MNFAYFRKSTHSVDETAQNVVNEAQKTGWKLIAQHPLPDDMGQMVLICRADWVKEVIAKEHQLLGFLPCAITVMKKGDDVLIGTGQPAVMQALAQSKAVGQMAATAEKELKELIHAAAGVGELKPTSVRLYSTQTCPYCTMEKKWLDDYQVVHEVVYVDKDQQEAERMVQRTGQMGVPVTEIGYEGGEAEFVVGFDRARLGQMLGIGH
jgi:glutaredoxin 3